MTDEGWTRVASVSDVKDGQVIRVMVDDEPLALANAGGEFLATSDVCTHEFVLLHDGWLEGEEIECPEHGSRFDMRTGAVVNLPATQPLPVYEVKVDGEDIFVRGPKK
jgi:nitrite reductase/ring-hydroxylating ferredoxin subunit